MEETKLHSRLARLENALRSAAELVSMRGEAYLPFFIALEEMLAEERQKSEALKRALALAEHIQNERQETKRAEKMCASNVQKRRPKTSKAKRTVGAVDIPDRLGHRMRTLLAHYAQEPPPTFGAMQVGPHTIALAMNNGLLDKTGGGDGWKGQYRTTDKGRIAIERDRILREEPKFKRARLIADLDACRRPTG